jgi:salicylate hydroxylase
LKEWGLDQKISDASVSVPEISLRSYRDGKILSSLALDPYMVDTYGFPNLYIHRADYHRILVEEAQRLGVRLQLGSKVTGVDSQKPAVQIQDQADVSADIVIGADGINSGCREALLGHPDPPRETGDLAYRVVIKRQDMRTHPLLSDISESSPTNYWLGPDSHAICYPLRGGDLYNLVIIRPDNLPDFVNVASANIQELQEYFTGWEPRFRAVLEMVEDATKWRMLSSEELKVWSSPSKKFVLLGDACHATLPYL